MPRFFCPVPLSRGAHFNVPESVARHVQVLRLQPGSEITLFNGEGGECLARIGRMGRRDVEVDILSHDPVEREGTREVHLAIGMPASERMDWLIEKATELGVSTVQPLLSERTVLRLHGDRAEKKRLHWQAVAVAACEQCGRNRVPAVLAVQSLPDWLLAAVTPLRLLLSLQADTTPLASTPGTHTGQPVLFLSGPEGGLSSAEESLARARGFQPVSLGPRTLRAETAPLAALAALTLGK